MGRVNGKGALRGGQAAHGRPAFGETTVAEAAAEAAERGWLDATSEGGRLALSLGGAWTVKGADALHRLVRDVKANGESRAAIDVSRVSQLDTAGAWLIYRTLERLRQGGLEAELVGVSDRHQPLVGIVEQAHARVVGEFHPPPTTFLRLVELIGAGAIEAGRKAVELTNFVGIVTIALARAAANPRRLRPVSLINQMELTGLRAIPIVGLLSFLIGVVLAYLMSDQLRQFGAEVFTVNLIGLSILREVGVLITAIMIAGRSGSAFTAEIGTMKVNEELDAMRTLGLDPVEVLVLPRVLALIVTLPFLAFFANVMGIFGGAVMTLLVLDLSLVQFVQQLKEAVDIDDFLVGLVKAPVHAYIIAVVGCFEGFKVERSAESVGKQTTVSVVESIFLVIVATSGFAIMFSILGI